MKKYIVFAATVAAAVLSSCTPKDLEPAAPAQVSITFTAEAPQTRTVFGEQNADKSYPVLWNAEDKQVAASIGYATAKALDVTPAADGLSASFTATFDAADSYRFILVNPFTAYKSVNKTNKTVLVEIPAAQTSTPAGPDPSAQILYGITEELTTLPSELPVAFAHATAYLHIFFKDLSLPVGASVQSVTIEAPEGCYIAGRNHFLPEEGKFNGEGTSQFNMISVSTDTADEVWCGIVPADLSGKSLRLTVGTDQGSLSKTITLPASAALASGDVVRFSVSMAGISAQEAVKFKLVSSESDLHWGDEIIIAAADSDVAMSTGQNSNNRSQAGITKNGGYIIDPASNVEIIKLEDGLVPGQWALRATGESNPGYLYAAGGLDDKGNYLRTQASVDVLASWSISFGDITDADKDNPDSERAIIKVDGLKRNLIRYNSGSSLFSAYNESTSMLPVKIYRKDVEADATSRFKVTNADGNTDDVVVSAAESTVPVYVFGNVAWTASVSGGASLDKTSGTGAAILTVSVPANAGSADKSYVVTVSTTASVTPASYTLNINQKAPVTTSLKVGDVLWSESWAGAEADDTPAAYQKRDEASTVVYGGASVVYSHTASNTKIWMDGLVYLPNGTNPIPDGCNPANLLIGKKSGSTSGSWKIAGIPCSGAKTVKLTYYSNTKPNNNLSVTTDTEGVTVGTVSNNPYKSEWNKDVNVISYEFTFSDSFAGDTFNISINNAHSSNIRVTDASVVVTAVKE